MIGVLIATHGLLARELVNSSEMLVGTGEAMDYACVVPGQAPEDFLAECQEKVEKLDSGEGVVALVDIPGGTPNNTMFRLTKTHNVRIVTGVNLAMVMSASMDRYDGMTADEFIDSMIETGTSQIMEFGKR